jgi:hypothetical protein
MGASTASWFSLDAILGRIHAILDGERHIIFPEQAEHPGKNARKHRINYRSERSMAKALVACLVCLDARSENQELQWKNVEDLIGSVMEYAYDTEFAAKHPECAEAISAELHAKCIQAVEKTTRDNVAKVFRGYNESRGYHATHGMRLTLFKLASEERSRQERLTVLSLLLIFGVNDKILSSRVRSSHKKKMDESLSVELIFGLCAEYLDHRAGSEGSCLCPADYFAGRARDGHGALCAGPGVKQDEVLDLSPQISGLDASDLQTGGVPAVKGEPSVAVSSHLVELSVKTEVSGLLPSPGGPDCLQPPFDLGGVGAELDHGDVEYLMGLNPEEIEDALSDEGLWPLTKLDATEVSGPDLANMDLDDFCRVIEAPHETVESLWQDPSLVQLPACLLLPAEGAMALS